jgi:polyadenylate-binding protein
MRDKASHDGKGFGFVNFATKEEAEAAVEALNDLPIEEEPEAGAGASSSTTRKLFVGPHQTKSERSRELMKQFKERKNDQTKACNLYIKNLGDEVTDDDLRQKFAKYGSITSARIMRDTSGANKGFGFVCFSSTDEANKASAELHRSMWNGRPLYVAVAQRRDERAEQIMKTRTDRTQQSLAAGGLYRGATFAPVAGGAPGTAVAPGVGGVPANMNMNMMNQQFLSMLAMQMLMQQQQQQQQAVAAANAASGGPSQVPSSGATAGAPRPTAVAPGSTAVALAQAPRGAPQAAQAPRPFSQVARQPAPTGVAPTQQPPRGYIAAVRQPAAAAPAPRGVVAAGPRGAMQPGYNGAPRVMMPTAVPAMGRVAPAGGAPAGVPSILDVLRTADPATHRNILGERLFPLVRAHQPEKASKITGMLLEMGTSEVLHLLEDPAALDSRVREAVSVLHDGVRA